MKIITCIFSVLSLFITGNIYAEPVINISTQYYDISGQTNSELLREMARKGPYSGRKRYWAITRWYVNYNFNFQPSEFGCSINTVQTNVNIEFIYPRWVDRARWGHARQNMGRQWDRMYQALVAHEETHASHGIAAARQIESELQKLSSRNNCHSLRRDFENRAQRIIQHYRNADIQFDRRTHHGRNEGVHLP